jgi:hypothetical protein
VDNDVVFLEKRSGELFECKQLESFYFPSQNIPEQSEITHEAIKWVLESSWTIFFKNKMTDPCKTVSYEGKSDQDLRVSGKKEKDEKRKDSTSSDEVELARGHITVFIQIKRIKVFKAVKFH